MLTVVPGAADADDPGRDNGSALIDELVREGARRMLAEALQAEVEDYIAPHLHERDEHGRRRVVRNGSHQPREVLTSADAVKVVAPPRPPSRPVNSRCCGSRRAAGVRTASASPWYAAEAFYVLEGKYLMYVEDRQQRWPPGTFVYVPRNTPRTRSRSFPRCPAKRLVLFSPTAMLGYFGELAAAEASENYAGTVAAITGRKQRRGPGPVPDTYL